MRATILLVIGLVFLCLALMGMAALPLLARPEIQYSATEHIPGIIVEPPTVTPTSTSTITLTPEPTSTSTGTPTFTPTLTTTLSPNVTRTATLAGGSSATATVTTATVTPGGPSPLPSLCDQAALVAHVTIPDGTILAPGSTFTKTWRLKNIGSCSWNTYYQLVFVSGEQMGAPASIAFQHDVQVGQTVDISVNMTAPSTLGSHRGYWMFKSSTGILFGIGQASTPWWVDINVSGPTVTPGGPSATPISSTPQATSIGIEVPSQIIEAEWPARIKFGQSGTLRVSLIRVGEEFVPTVEIPGNTAIASTPISIGTPGVEPGEAFGEGYEAYAVAHIAGASFVISSASPEFQTLDQPRVDWIWNITSNNPGVQGIDISIEMEWRPINNDGESLKRTIWRSHLDIEVYQPIVSMGQISAFSLLSAFIGSGLSIPWLYELSNKRRAQQRRKAKKRL